MANAYYVARLGYEMYQLTEHAASGLPDLDELLAWADSEGTPYVLRSDGWLYHWLSFLLVKIHLLAERDDGSHRRVDTAFNLLLRDADRRAPHYRRAVILRPPDGLPGMEPVPDQGDVDADLRRLAELASEITIALPAGSAPAAPASPLRNWIARTRTGTAPLALAARDLELVLDAVAERRAARAARAASTGTSPMGLSCPRSPWSW